MMLTLLCVHVSSDTSDGRVVLPRLRRWSALQIERFLHDYPQRAYFPRLAQLGLDSGRAGPELGVEVGSADGRFSELALLDSQPDEWKIVEPFPNPQLKVRLGLPCESGGSCAPAGVHDWASRGVGRATNVTLLRGLPLDAPVLSALPDGGADWIYLDGAHDYETVKKELFAFWPKVRPGGVLTGHDYCNYGEQPLGCRGCDRVPACLPYTDYGLARGKAKPPARAKNQQGVVRAVQEWMVEAQPGLTLYHTRENYTRASLAADGLAHDLVVTMTYNPSWLIIKPDDRPPLARPCGAGRLSPPFDATRKCLPNRPPLPLREINQRPAKPAKPAASALRPNGACGRPLPAAPPNRIGGTGGVASQANPEASATEAAGGGGSITLAILAYASPALLLSHLTTVGAYPAPIRLALDVLIVDDGSPRGLDAESHVSARHAAGLRSLRIATIAHDLQWNIGGARNLAFHLASTERVLLLDADIVAPPAAIDAILRTCHTHLPPPGAAADQPPVPAVYKFNRRRPSGEHKVHPAAVLIGVAQYWQAGGCDEDFVGSYGFTDVHFDHRVRRLQAASLLALEKKPSIILEEHANMPPCDATVLPTHDEAHVAAHSRCVAAATAWAAELSLSRNTSRNMALMERKVASGCWSNEYLRFDWTVHTITPEPSPVVIESRAPPTLITQRHRRQHLRWETTTVAKA